MDEVGGSMDISRANEGYTSCGPVVEMSWHRAGVLSHPENSKYINCCLIGIFRNNFKKSWREDLILINKFQYKMGPDKISLNTLLNTIIPRFFWDLFELRKYF